MQINRVEEIIKSPDNVQVLYKEHPVWLEGVYKDSFQVRVKLLDTAQMVDVKPEELTEKH